MSLKELGQVLKAKHNLVKERLPVRWQAPENFRLPMCKTCGGYAIVTLEPDGACGDPECCPQSSHIEFTCRNEACPVFTERLP